MTIKKRKEKSMAALPFALPQAVTSALPVVESLIQCYSSLSMCSCREDSSSYFLASGKSIIVRVEPWTLSAVRFIWISHLQACVCVWWSEYLAGFGSFLASVESAEQQVIRGHDGRGLVSGECVYDFREGVAQHLCHVFQHGWVEILRRQPGNQKKGFGKGSRMGRRKGSDGPARQEMTCKWKAFRPEQHTDCGIIPVDFGKRIISSRSRTWLHFHSA